MEKKKYFIPTVKEVEVRPYVLQMTSTESGSGQTDDNQQGEGGDSRQMRKSSVWEEEELEE